MFQQSRGRVNEGADFAFRFLFSVDDLSSPCPGAAAPSARMSSLPTPGKAAEAAVEVARQLAAYFAGDLTDFDLPLAPEGSDFQQRVWAQLRTIGYGETATYGAIAHRLGMTHAASRAVGLANGRNPIPIVIPCHRVIGADGTLTGYAGGLARKQVLLDLERTDALW